MFIIAGKLHPQLGMQRGADPPRFIVKMDQVSCKKLLAIELDLY